jgi:hypothetical protein
MSCSHPASMNRKLAAKDIAEIDLCIRARSGPACNETSGPGREYVLVPQFSPVCSTMISSCLPVSFRAFLFEILLLVVDQHNLIVLLYPACHSNCRRNDTRSTVRNLNRCNADSLPAACQYIHRRMPALNKQPCC